MDAAANRESLLNASEDPEAGGALQATGRHKGVLFKLRLGPQGVTMQQVEEKSPASCPDIVASLCRFDSGLPTQIPEGDIVGATASGASLTIWHAPLAGAGGERPSRHTHRTASLQLDSQEAAEQAAHMLRSTCCWRGADRPPRLLVIVNPASGPGKAPSIYDKQVRPVFEAAGCQLEMHVTERRHHATGELCMPGLRMLEASSCDQLCALAKPCAAFANCGGMAWAKDREAHMCRKPAHGAKAAARLPARPAHYAELVQQVAPGSFDVIVAIGGDGTTHEVLQGLLGRPDWDATRRTPFAQIPCGSGNALAASVGLWTVDTAVHAVVKGHQRAFDVASVLQQSPPRRCFSFLSVNYGMITNLDIGTEHLRWMGGTRFVVGALQQILLKKKHAARVAILDCSARTAAEAAAAAAADGGAEAAQKPTDALAEAAAFPGPPVQHLAAFQQLAGQQLPAGWEWLPDPEVSLFAASNLPRLDMNFHFAPAATLDSGHFNLIWTPPASRRHGFAVLTASEKGKHMLLVKQRCVTAMTLEPRSTGTWLVVDGEEVPFTPLFMEVHPSLCCTIVAPTLMHGSSDGAHS
ncbi:hypothetical protein ABPG77_004127 [Micractinium sp. CCAP 211/92]